MANIYIYIYGGGGKSLSRCPCMFLLAGAFDFTPCRVTNGLRYIVSNNNNIYIYIYIYKKYTDIFSKIVSDLAVSALDALDALQSFRRKHIKFKTLAARDWSAALGCSMLASRALLGFGEALEMLVEPDHSPCGSNWLLETATRARNGSSGTLLGAATGIRLLFRTCTGTAKIFANCFSSLPQSQDGHAARRYPGAENCSTGSTRTTAPEECCFLFVYFLHHYFLGSAVLRAWYARFHSSIYKWV